MQHASRLGRLVALSTLVLVNVAWGQDTLRTPSYRGCVPDETLREEWMPENYNPLRCQTAVFSLYQDNSFESTAFFHYATFESSTDLENTKFGSLPDIWKERWKERARLGADFESIRFDTLAFFYYAKFDSLADFSSATFDGKAVFDTTRFKSPAGFNNAKFLNQANFSEAMFGSQAFFAGAKFDSLVVFENATFDSLAAFPGARFDPDSTADFSSATFDGRAGFGNAEFDGPIDFSQTTFESVADFSGASFWDEVDFLEAEFASTAIADFTRASVRDTIRIGNWKTAQRFDFRRVNFLQSGSEVRLSDIPPSDSVEVAFPGAAVIVHAPVDIQLQVEKLDFLHLAGSLSYFEKKNIVSYLKDNSFNEDDQKAARFELDYLFARSTMDQRPSGRYEEYPWYHYRLWWNHIYYYLMGFGYRPFWIFLWAGLIVFLFGVYYRWGMPHQTYAYVQNTAQSEFVNSDNPGQPQLRTPLIHCLYFSTMVFFTFRLKRKILTFFDAREQRIIVAQWVTGFLIYVAFLTLAKSGSILQQLKVLFVG